jgi:hypothetical protein
MRVQIPLILLLGGLSGCATSESVRYVYQDKSFGVIGMPENTDRWPNHYHRRAEKLMKEHFPEGYEIVRAEEVTEGSRTLRIEGSSTAEINPQIPADILKIAKLGRTSTRSQADTVRIKECRIVYRRTSHTQDTTFAFDVDVNPTHYVDPNEAERHTSTVKKDVTNAKSSKSNEG